jgi:signal transduction histidine kinase
MSTAKHVPPWRQTLRIRVTIGASLIVTAAVVLGVLTMYALQMSSVRRTIDDQLSTYAARIAQNAETSGWPPVLPRSNLDGNAEAQVLAADGTVLAATRTLQGLPAVYALAPGATVPVRQRAADGAIPTEIRVVATRVTVAGRPVVVLTGTGTDLLSEVNEEFLHHLLAGLPVILLLSAGMVWLVTGRALRPVDRIRRAVTDITSADLSRRVPDPGTGDEIGRLARTMNDMLARLEDSAHRQRRFVADASHELRSPLAAIRTTLEVGLAHPERAPWPAIAGRAAGQAIRLEELLQHLLLLAKADEGQPVGPGRPVDVGTLLDDIRADIVTHDIALHLSTQGSPVATGDPETLSRLFRNIIDNAVRYARTEVRITATTSPAAVRVHVVDDGPGIPADQRDRVFDRFVRLDTSRDRATGTTGLGLAIAREIATAHHGAITVTDADIGGADVLITLPAAAPRLTP